MRSGPSGSGALVGLGALRLLRRGLLHGLGLGLGLGLNGRGLRRGLGGRREARLRVEVVLVEEELAERVVQEPAVAVVAAVLVLEVARVLDDLADVRPV